MSQLFNAPLAKFQFFSNYSRLMANGQKESFLEAIDRIMFGRNGLIHIGRFDKDETELVYKNLLSLKAFGSARFMWCGGTSWLDHSKNYYGVYKCSTRSIESLDDIRIMTLLGMCGTGTGSVLVNTVFQKINVCYEKLEFNTDYAEEKTGQENFKHRQDREGNLTITIGDSKESWADAIHYFLSINCSSGKEQFKTITIDLSRTRKKGCKIAGFGGSTNPENLPDMFRIYDFILRKNNGSYLTPTILTYLLDAPSSAIVPGGVRRFAAIKQYDASDKEASVLKQNLWRKNDKGGWISDPMEQKVLSSSNHTSVYFDKPSRAEIFKSIYSQYHSGEGAIQYAPEAIARSNADLLNTVEKKSHFLNLPRSARRNYLLTLNPSMSSRELDNRINRYGLNPCAEMVAWNNLCNLSTVQLRNIDPFNLADQKSAYQAAAIQAAALLHLKVDDPEFRYSQEIDPIILVSFTSGYNFFIRAFGAEWLRWMHSDRPESLPDILHGDITRRVRKLAEQFGLDIAYEPEKAGKVFTLFERKFFEFWKTTVFDRVEDYCRKHDLRSPNRMTGLKPEGSLTLLTDCGSCGIVPPKDWYYIRRKSFVPGDPVCVTALELGLGRVVPGSNDLDENGNLLGEDDLYHPNCKTWLLEVPVKESVLEEVPEAIDYSPNQLSAVAQFDFFMAAQNHYATHNISITLEFRESEINALTDRVYENIQNNGGYVSMAMFARSDDSETFPRLPFEPITEDEYYNLLIANNTKRIHHSSMSFEELLSIKYEGLTTDFTPSSAACESTECEMKH